MMGRINCANVLYNISILSSWCHFISYRGTLFMAIPASFISGGQWAFWVIHATNITVMTCVQNFVAFDWEYVKLHQSKFWTNSIEIPLVGRTLGKRFQLNYAIHPLTTCMVIPSWKNEKFFPKECKFIVSRELHLCASPFTLCHVIQLR